MSPHIHVQIQPGNTTEYIRADGTLGTPGGGGGAPIGSILWWSPLNGAVPTGWAECDGTANAPGPDLRDRFVVGRGTGHTVDTTGGANTHTHAGHAAHVVTQPSGHSVHADNIEHSHLISQVRNATTGGATTDIAKTTDTSSTLGTTTSTDLSGTGGTLAHSAHTGTDVDAHSAHDTPDSQPTWYALIYIQKL